MGAWLDLDRNFFICCISSLRSSALLLLFLKNDQLAMVEMKLPLVLAEDALFYGTFSLVFEAPNDNAFRLWRRDFIWLCLEEWGFDLPCLDGARV